MNAYVVVDLEMTGLRTARDKILEIGAVRVEGQQCVEEYHTMVNPGVDIPAEITALTGITQEMVAEGMSPQDAVTDFLAFCREMPLVGHNIPFDYGFLKQAAKNAGLQLECPVLDTLKLARKLLPDLSSRSLEALCRHYGIALTEHHRALEDARATAVLYQHLWQEFGEKNPQLFEPYPLKIRVKKQGPITPRQKKYLKELAEYHKIELPLLDGYTKSEASRLTDRLISQYGKL